MVCAQAHSAGQVIGAMWRSPGRHTSLETTQRRVIALAAVSSLLPRSSRGKGPGRCDSLVATPSAGAAAIVATTAGAAPITVAPTEAARTTAPVAVAAAITAAGTATEAAAGTHRAPALGLQLLRGRHLTAQRGAAREVDAPLRVHLDYHHGNLIAGGHDILRPVDLIIGELRRAHQTLFTRQNLHERAEVHQPAHRTRINLADLNLLCQRTHRIHRAIHAILRDGRDVHRAIIVNVNLRTGLVLNAADRLAARADDRANLIRVDLDGLNARRIRRQVLMRLRQRLQHLVHDVHATLFGLGHCLREHLRRQPLDLDIHLEGRDAIRRTRDFEVHVAHSVFEALDV